VTNSEAKALVAKHASELAEQFETVRIFVSWPHADDAHRTMTYDTGRGNWFASYGQIRQWVIAEDEALRKSVRESEDET
jgi:hypothetical protein